MKKKKNTNLKAPKGNISENARLRRIVRLIELLMDKETEPQTKARIRDWFADAGGTSYVDEGIAGYIESLKPSDMPLEADTLRRYNAVAAKLGLPPERKLAPVRKLRRVPVFGRVAAVLIAAVMIGGGVFFVLNDRKAPVDLAQHTVQIPKGEHTMILLPDGSEIRPGEGSTIKYSEDFLNDRTVYLDGEAYFKVEKKDGQTFTVNTSSITVTVLGTEFSLKARGAEQTAEVVLTTGKVEVSAVGVDNTTISPGERVVYDKDHKTISIDEVGERELMRLRGMSLDFDNSLSEIFWTVSRYYGKTLIVRDSMDLGRHIIVPFDGTETVEEVMDGLQFMTGGAFDYTLDRDTIKITNPL